MTAQTTVALVTMVCTVAVVAWFDARCLADLARTSDRDLVRFDRRGWALVIVLAFPIGPMLYMTYAKGPRRFR